MPETGVIKTTYSHVCKNLDHEDDTFRPAIILPIRYHYRMCVSQCHPRDETIQVTCHQCVMAFAFFDGVAAFAVASLPPSPFVYGERSMISSISSSYTFQIVASPGTVYYDNRVVVSPAALRHAISSEYAFLYTI